MPFESTTLLSFAGPLLLYAEEIDATTGQHLGPFPQAFTHLALIDAVTRIIEMESKKAPQNRHKIAIGLTGEPVATESRSGAITHRNVHRPNSAHSGARTEKSR